MATPVYAPYSQSYATREPYITAAEYIASPTGVDTTNLVPAGTAAQNLDALNQTIDRASSAADMICNQILSATLETEYGPWRVQSDGTVIITTGQFPITAVYGLSFNDVPAPDISALTPSAIAKQQITIPASLVAGRANTQGLVSCGLTYVAGYANSITSTASAVADVALTLDDTLGISPGMTLTVNDPGQTERVVVAAVTDTTVTVTKPLRYPHAVGVNVSALPPAIKQAVVLLTSALIKTRGDASFIFQTTRSTPDEKKLDAEEPTEVTNAVTLLRNFKRVI